MFKKIMDLKHKGYFPDTILDIGAHFGHWTLNVKNIYEQSKYYLFEGIDYRELDYVKSIDNVQVFNVILNDEKKVVNWYEKRNTGDSMFLEKTKHFVDCQSILKQSIDLNSLIKEHNILSQSENIFIKIDCQGAEIPILKGATDILEKTDFILLEIPFFGTYNEGVPNFLEHIKYMESINFVPYDILENHYINTFNMQVDMLFINKNHPFNEIVNEMLLKN